MVYVLSYAVDNYLLFCWVFIQVIGHLLVLSIVNVTVNKQKLMVDRTGH